MAFRLVFYQCSPDYTQKITDFVEAFQSDQEQFILQTSGSTGPPKQLTVQKEQLIASAKRSNRYFQLGEHSSVGLCLSIDTVGGKMALVRALIGQYAIHICTPTRNPDREFPPTLELDFISLVPYQATAVLTESPVFFSRMKQVLLGGAPIHSKLENQLIELKSNFYMGYGMTETISHVAIRKLGSPYYHPLSGVKFWKNNNKTFLSDAELSIDALELTDQLEFQHEHQFTWNGRLDFAIISGGIKIHPELLENELSAYLTEPFIVAGIPDESLGQRCVVIIESEKHNFQIDKIKEICKNKFGAYAVPKAMYYHLLVRTPSLKIDRAATIQQLISTLG